MAGPGLRNKKEGTKMNRTAKEELVFSAINTIGMVVIMVSYNVIQLCGATVDSIGVILLKIVPIFIAAFLVAKLVVDHNVHALHRILVSPHDPAFKHILVLSILMVTGMCFAMTLYTTILYSGTGGDFFSRYLGGVARNYPVALISQLLVVGPLSRVIHLKIFRRSELVM